MARTAFVTGGAGFVGPSSPVVLVPYEQAYGHGIEEMFQRIPATDKIREAVGWSPSVDLEEILKKSSPIGSARE